jgi:hypothetical protein
MLVILARNTVTAQKRVYVGNVAASLIRAAELFTEAVQMHSPVPARPE